MCINVAVVEDEKTDLPSKVQLLDFRTKEAVLFLWAPGTPIKTKPQLKNVSAIACYNCITMVTANSCEIYFKVFLF